MSGGVEKVRAGGVRVRRGVGALGLVALIAGCGNSSISGEYVGQPGSWVDKLVFGPGNEVRAVNRGDAAAGVFRVESKEIFLTIGTDQTKLTIAANGCLDAGRLGIYCKR